MTKHPADPADPADFTPRFPEVVDSTMLASYDACPTKFWYEYVNCLSSVATSPDLHAGGAFARGLEVARRHYYLAGKSANESILDGLRAFTLFWGDYEPPDKNGSPHQKDYINTADAFLDYFREYPLETDPISPYIMAGGVPAIEFTFAIPLPFTHPDTGSPILLGGRLDMLGYYKSLVAVVDEKTTKSITSNGVRVYPMRGQFITYVWAAQLHGIPAEIALIRMIAIQKTQTRHIEYPLPIGADHIKKWHRHMLTKVEAMRRDYVSGDWMMSFGDACSSYGGCQFLDLCTSRDPTVWFNTFERRVWNPLFRTPDRKDNPDMPEVPEVPEVRHVQ